MLVCDAASGDTGSPDAATRDAGPEDSQLVALAREGSVPAFEELVRRHQDRAYTLAVRLVGDRHEAQDVVQEVFVAAWRGLGAFDGRAAFSTWLHRIVVTRASNQRRSRTPVPAETDVEVAAPERTEDVVQARAEEQALMTALGSLPEDVRTPLILVTFLGCSYEEAGDIVGVPGSTVRGRVARARRALLQALEGWT